MKNNFKEKQEKSFCHFFTFSLFLMIFPKNHILFLLYSYPSYFSYFVQGKLKIFKNQSPQPKNKKKIGNR